MKTLTNVALLCKFLSDQGRYIELFTKNVALEHSDVAQCTTTFDALAAAAKRKSSTEFVVRLAVLEKELTAWKTAQKRHTDAVMTVDASDGGCEKAKKELMLGIKKLKAEVAAYTRDGGGAAADDAASGDENDVTWLGTKIRTVPPMIANQLTRTREGREYRLEVENDSVGDVLKRTKRIACAVAADSVRQSQYSKLTDEAAAGSSFETKMLEVYQEYAGPDTEKCEPEDVRRSVAAFVAELSGGIKRAADDNDEFFSLWKNDCRTAIRKDQGTADGSKRPKP
jgi:hypothetical protein